MKRAAVIPSGWAGLVVADDGAMALRPVVVESFEVGHLVNDGSSLGRTKRREVSDPIFESTLHNIVMRLTGLYVEYVVIDLPKPDESRFRELADRIGDRMTDLGIQVRMMSKWRTGGPGDRAAWAKSAISAGFEWWPDGTYDVARQAGAMLLESIRRDAQGITEPTVTVAGQTHDTFVPLTGPTSTAQAERIKLGVDSGRNYSVVKPVGPCIAGIDPGSSKLGLTIAEGTVAPLRLVLTKTLPVGRTVPLAKPKTIKRGDETITITTRHSVTPEMVEELASEVVELLKKHRVTRLALEHVASVHIAPQKAAAASAISTALIFTSWVDMVIGQKATAAGIEVSRVQRASWTAVVAGRKKRGGEGTELIAPAIRAGFSNWPEVSDDHQRDSAGVCLWLVAPEAEEKKPKEHKPREIRLSRHDHAEKRRAALVVCGCTCDRAPGQRGSHRKGCPMQHRKKGTLQMCSVCGEIRLGHRCTGRSPETGVERG